MSDDNAFTSWFAVRVRPNFEHVVCSSLQERGLESFLPTYRSRRTWTDRTKVLDLPLFPSYLFCRTPRADGLAILPTPGVRDFVRVGRTPAAIPDAEIDAVRRFLECDLNVRPWPFLERGQRVVIERGPLAGIEGVIQEFKGQCNIVVSISILQRSVAATLDGSWLRGLKAA